MEFSKLTFTQTKRIFLEYKNYVNESLDDSSSSQPRFSCGILYISIYMYVHTVRIFNFKGLKFRG